jgi:ribosomal protein L11 methyltransferase
MTSTSKHPGWIRISIDIDPVAQEAMSAFLFELGCQGLVADATRETKTHAFLSADRKMEEIGSRLRFFSRRLTSIFPEMSPPTWSLSEIEPEDWSQGWRRFFHPERITDNLEVIPAWEPPPETSSGHVIRMDPGPAFGTGQHATTRMCLEVLETIAPPRAWALLDAGTGSGILAIYGAMLGASPVEAVDIDAEAVRWAKENMALNGVSSLIQTATRPIASVEGHFAVVTANLTRQLILDSLPHFRRILDPGGRLVLSGILVEEVGAVREKLPGSGLEEARCFRRDEWACLLVGG